MIPFMRNRDQDKMAAPPKLTVVIIGCGGTAYSPGQMPTPEDVQICSTILSPIGCELNVVIIDPILKYACRIAKGLMGPVDKNYRDDAEKIAGYDANVTVIDEHVNKASGEWKEGEEPVIYLCYGTLTSSYQVMSLLNCYIIKNRYFINISPESEGSPLKEVCEDYCKLVQGEETSFLYDEVYDLYSGDKLLVGKSSDDMKDAVKQIMSGCFIVCSYYKAGYDKRENTCNVDGWCLNPETPFIKGCILTYGLISPVPDSTAILQVTTNSGFRYQLLELLSKVIVNFAMTNSILTIETASQLGGFKTAAVYHYIADALTPAFRQLMGAPRPS